MQYQQFLKSKEVAVLPSGFNVREEEVNKQLFPFQRDIVVWALRRGKSAIFADCGLGKTPMQLEWAKHVVAETGGNVLILAPLAVSVQTQREGEKFGIEVNVARTTEDIRPGINITNYERLHYFEELDFAGIVLDESSILKAFSGKIRKQITEFAKKIPYRLACTATPAPNDLVELLNHAEFLEIMTGKEMIALFFTQDGNSTHKWRLKGHARDEFWRWMSTWSVAMRKPSDLGYDDDGFILPELTVHQITTKGVTPQGYLFPVKALTLDEQRAARRGSIPDRVAATAEMVNGSDEPWIIWCNLNDESSALTKAIPDAVEVKGADKPEYKEESMLAFSEGKIRVLVTKPTIAGFGMNWQHCARSCFVGLSHSYEQFYQATRRIWRFGQEREVNVYVITAENEGAVVDNIKRKEQQSMDMFDNIVEHMAVNSEVKAVSASRMVADYETDVRTGENWTMYLGDNVEMIDRLEDDSVGLVVTSPPFPGMYIYTNSPRDMGNVQSLDEMIEHFRYLVNKDKLMRVLMPGRSIAIHLTQLTAMKSREGYMGLHDYRGAVIRLMEEEGWHWTGEAAISKNPQIQATRNKEHQLLFKSLAKDSAMMRPALPDWLLVFRKPGDNPKPIRAGISQRYDNPNGWISEEDWIKWADGIWWLHDLFEEQGVELDLATLTNVMTWPYYSTKYGTAEYGIRETDVLNVKQARETDDERHLCPLQLGVIERAIKLWSAPDEIVLDPFTGIGSVGHKALILGRKFVGMELKRSYFLNSCVNLSEAEEASQNMDLFTFAGLKVGAVVEEEEEIYE